MLWTILLGLLLLLAPVRAHSQVVCEEFENSPQPCKSFLVGSWSWVATAPSLGISQEVLHAQMLQPVQQTSDTFISLLDLIALHDYECGVAYARALCLAFFSPCDPDKSEPVPVCRSICLNYLKACGRKAQKEFCDQLHPVTGAPLFTNSSKACNSLTIKPFVYPCPQPTVYQGRRHSKENTGLPCNVPCTGQLSRLITKRDLDDLEVAKGLSWLAVFSCLAVIAVYLYFPALKEDPSRLVVFSALGCLLVNIAWAGSSVQNPEDFTCDDNGIDLKSGGWRTAAGFLFFLGSMILTSWWCAQVLIVARIVGFKQFCVRLGTGLHLWCWGHSLICSTIITFAPSRRNLGAFDALLATSISGTQLNAFWVGVFEFILAIDLLLAAVGLAMTCWRAVRSESGTQFKEQASGFTSNLLFGVWFLIALLGAIALESSARATKHGIFDSLEEEGYRCWFTTRGHWRDCVSEFNWDRDINRWFGLLISITGIAIFVIYIPLNAKVRQCLRSSNLPCRTTRLMHFDPVCLNGKRLKHSPQLQRNMEE